MLASYSIFFLFLSSCILNEAIDVSSDHLASGLTNDVIPPASALIKDAISPTNGLIKDAIPSSIASEPLKLVQVQVDAPTETTTVSWGTQIKNSLGEFLIGIIIFIASFPLLIWNECKSARQYRLLEGAEKSVRKDLKAQELKAENQGKLVHVYGEIKTVETLGDATFGIQAQNCVKLRRTVEMYQWRENVRETKEDNLGGSQTVQRTYTYELVWSSSALSSRDFRNKQGHENPEFPLFVSKDWQLGRAHFGDYVLGPPLIDQASWWESLDVKEKDLENIQPQHANNFKVLGGRFYRGASDQYPQVGDVRVKFDVTPCDSATVLGRQVGNSFEGWEPTLCPCLEKVDNDAKYDEERQRLLQDEQSLTVRVDHILYLTREHKSANYIIEQRRTLAAWVTWIWRLVGFIMMCGGLYSIFQPIIVLLKVVPFIAALVSSGLFVVCFVTTLVLTLVIVSLAWVIARPLLVTCCVALGVGIFVLVSKVKQA